MCFTKGEVMRSIRTGFIFFNKSSKMFDCSEGELTDDLHEANVYPTRASADNQLEIFDRPEDFEIWEIEIEYRTR
jgi:hypothetical protein